MCDYEYGIWFLCRQIMHMSTGNSIGKQWASVPSTVNLLMHGSILQFVYFFMGCVSCVEFQFFIVGFGLVLWFVLSQMG